MSVRGSSRSGITLTDAQMESALAWMHRHHAGIVRLSPSDVAQNTQKVGPVDVDAYTAPGWALARVLRDGAAFQPHTLHYSSHRDDFGTGLLGIPIVLSDQESC